MRSRTSTAPLFWVLAFLLISCNLPGLVAPQPAPSTNPGSLGSIAALTAAAAATQTALLIPSTPTATLTPPPTDTSTLTPTFFFRITPGTPIPWPTLTTPTPGPAPGELSCKVRSQSVKNGTHFNPQDTFVMGWKVTNDGTAAWDPSEVYFAYVGGTKMHLEPKIALPTVVISGDSVGLSVDMAAPKNSSAYTTIWALRRGPDTFCQVSLRIIVP
jgi:hypothetical protein